jgi:hypothetical protein
VQNAALHNRKETAYCQSKPSWIVNISSYISLGLPEKKWYDIDIALAEKETRNMLKREDYISYMYKCE